MTIRRRQSSLWVAATILSGLLFASSYSQTQQDASKRRIVLRVAPGYPVLARSMGLQGMVRVDAFVSADGSVKSVDLKGGHPVLAQAAVNAVRQWKWEPASHESHESVEVKFSPE
jgi:TonB family protein